MRALGWLLIVFGVIGGLRGAFITADAPRAEQAGELIGFLLFTALLIGGGLRVLRRAKERDDGDEQS